MSDELERAILALLAERAEGVTVCPSEVARRVAGRDEADWRPLMESVRAAAARLAAQGRVAVLQRGRAVDPGAARGPIRLRASGAGSGAAAPPPAHGASPRTP